MVVESKLPAGTGLQYNREAKRPHRTPAARLLRRSTRLSGAAGFFAFAVFAAFPSGAATSTTEAETTTTTAVAEETTTTTAAPDTTVTTAPAETTTSAAGTGSTTDTTASAGETTTTSAPATSGGTDAGGKDKIEAAETAKAREVDAANAQLSELTNALSVLQSDVNTQAAKVEIATRSFEAAQARAEAAAVEVRELEAIVAELEFELSDQAIRSFKGETIAAGVLALRDNPNTGMRKATMLSKATQSDIDYANRLAGVREDLLARNADTEEALALAEESRRANEEQLAALEQNRVAQGALASKAEQRLDHLLSERAALARLGDGVAPDVDEQEAAALVAQLASAPAPPPRTTGSSGIPAPVPQSEIVVAAKGIEVHESIVDNVRRLLADAAAAGIDLAGGGYRDPARQIAVRKANCGTSNFAIYEMRSSQCSPPTARPGRSQHEQGKAIDFTYNGALIRSRSGAGWNWLNANANSYGLYNLPSEPWHWSVNGR